MLAKIRSMASELREQLIDVGKWAASTTSAGDFAQPADSAPACFPGLHHGARMVAKGRAAQKAQKARKFAVTRRKESGDETEYVYESSESNDDWKTSLVAVDLATGARKDGLSPKHIQVYQEMLCNLVNVVLPRVETAEGVQGGWKSFNNGLNAQTTMRNCKPWLDASPEQRQLYVDRIPELSAEIGRNGHATDSFLHETFPFEGADSYNPADVDREQLGDAGL